MSSFLLGFDLVLTFALSVGLLYNYGNWYRHPIPTTFAVLIAFYFSLVIVTILPLDLAATVYEQCRNTTGDALSQIGNSSNLTISVICPVPSSYPGEGVFLNLWRIVYWSSQLLTWLLLPMMQSYSKAGEFTVKGKLQSALLDNAIYYGSYLFICGVLVAYIAVRPELKLDWPSLKAIASSASNTWGLFLLTFMLGYGLVTVPRSLWYSANRGHSLNNAYFRMAKLSEERNSSEEGLDDALENLHSSMKSLPANSHLAVHLDTILTQVPLEFRERMNRRRVESPGEPVTEKNLVRLHRRMKAALQTYHRTETQWDMQILAAVHLEDVERNAKSRDKMFKRTFVDSTSLLWKYLGPRFEWIWKCMMSRWVFKGIAVVCASLSVAVIWSEATFFIQSPALSLFAIFVNLSKSSYDYFAIEFIATLTIAYLCVCSYYTVFKIRIFNLYYLAGNHQTDEYSLIFAGMLLCRLTPPICLNFLGMVHMDRHIIHDTIKSETSYTQVMGHLDVLSIISDGFNIYFPMGILVIGLFTWFKVGARVLSAIGFQQFLVDDDVTIDLVTEGQQLVSREKRRRQRRSEDNSGASTSERRGKISRITQQTYSEQPPPPNLSREVTEDPETWSDRPINYSHIAYGSDDNGRRQQQLPPRDLFDDV